MKVYPQKHRLGFREYDFLSIHSKVLAKKLFFINQYTSVQLLRHKGQKGDLHSMHKITFLTCYLGICKDHFALNLISVAISFGLGHFDAILTSLYS